MTIQIPEHSEKCQLGHDTDCPHEAAEAILKQVIEMVKEHLDKAQYYRAIDTPLNLYWEGELDVLNILIEDLEAIK